MVQIQYRPPALSLLRAYFRPIIKCCTIYAQHRCIADSPDDRLQAETEAKTVSRRLSRGVGWVLARQGFV